MIRGVSRDARPSSPEVGKFVRPLHFLSYLPRYSSRIFLSDSFSRRVASRSNSMYFTTNRNCSSVSYNSAVNSSSCLCCGRTLMVLLCSSLMRLICCNNSETFFSIASSNVAPHGQTNLTPIIKDSILIRHMIGVTLAKKIILAIVMPAVVFHNRP